MKEKVNIKISVITPSYNQGQFLEDAIRSVMEQNYDFYEHIIVDNCSADNTHEVVRKYPHVRFLSEPDAGQSHALNKGIAMAQGEWILWLNADDLMMPGAFKSLLDTICTKPNLDFVYGHTLFIDENGHKIKTVYHIPFNYALVMLGIYSPPSTGSFFRTGFIKDKPFSMDFHYVMDTEWFLKYGVKLRSALVDTLYSAFRVSANNKTSESIISGHYNEKHLYERRTYHRLYIAPWKKNNHLSNRYIHGIARLVMKNYYYVCKSKYLCRYIKNRIK